MKTLSHTEPSVLQVLLSRIEDSPVQRAASAVKPKHRADQVAAAVAESGNPSGA
jgi:hypothetical protein